MCRWVIYRGPPVRLEDVLVKPSHSSIQMAREHYIPNVMNEESDIVDLLYVARRNLAINLDGFGMGWYPVEPAASAGGKGKDDDDEEEDKHPSKLKPVLYKTILDPQDDEQVHQLTKQHESCCIFAHNRASSAGKKDVINCHPWKYGRLMWMHNGTVARFGDVRAGMVEEMGPDFAAQIQGKTDSECAFFLFWHYLALALSDGRTEKPFVDAEAASAVRTSAEVLADCMDKTIKKIVKLVDGVCDEECRKRELSSLNFAVTDGVNVVGSRFRDSPSEPPPSLYYAHGIMKSLPDGSLDFVEPTPGRDKQHRRAAIISSEPLINNEASMDLQVDWQLVKGNHLVILDEHRNLTTRPISVNFDVAAEKFVRRIKWLVKPAATTEVAA